MVFLAAVVAGAVPAAAADPSLLLQAEAQTLAGDCKGARRRDRGQPQHHRGDGAVPVAVC